MVLDTVASETPAIFDISSIVIFAIDFSVVEQQIDLSSKLKRYRLIGSSFQKIVFPVSISKI